MWSAVVDRTLRLPIRLIARYYLTDNRRQRNGRRVVSTKGRGERGEIELQLQWTEQDEVEDIDSRRYTSILLFVFVKNALAPLYLMFP